MVELFQNLIKLNYNCFHNMVRRKLLGYFVKFWTELFYRDRSHTLHCHDTTLYRMFSNYVAFAVLALFQQSAIQAERKQLGPHKHTLTPRSGVTTRCVLLQSPEYQSHYHSSVG